MNFKMFKIFKSNLSFIRPFSSSIPLTKHVSELKGSYDVVIIGAGHNGLISAAYLQKAGYTVCVLEKRPVIGGAAVTEEIIPGFKFSCTWSGDQRW